MLPNLPPSPSAPPQPTLRPVLIITGNQTLASTWQPLSEHYDLCFVGPQVAVAQDMGIPGVFALNQLANSDTSEEAVNVSYKVAARLYDAEVMSKIVGVVEGVLGEERHPAISSDRVRDWWPAMLGEHVRQGAAIIETLNSLVSQREVVGLIVHEDVSHDMRVLVQWCKGRGIPTIHIPHASCFYVGKEWDIHTESICDYICAAGEYMKEWYIKWGFREEKIRVTGAPQLDSWYAENPPSRKESRQALGMKDDEYVIVCATTWGQLTSARGEFENEHLRNLEAVFTEAKAMGATVCLSLHPGEARGQEEFYTQKMKEAGVNGCVLRGYVEYVLRAADMLVAPVSNVCVSAAIVGLPSVYFPTEGFEIEGGPVRYSGDMKEDIRDAENRNANKIYYWDSFANLINDRHGHEESAASRTAKAIVHIISQGKQK